MRRCDLGESMDDQTEIVEALAAEDLVVPLYDETGLAEAIRQAKEMKVQSVLEYELPGHIAATIDRLLDK